jgi:N-acyl-D-amino-acid deacylase
MQLTPQHVIDYMRTQPLQFDPGTRFAYSNFGYCLLGRVIEKIGGAPYGAYVQRETLAPLGVRRMTLGRGGNERAQDEVDYDLRRDRSGQVRVRTSDDAPREAANSWRIELMDSHGGWLASSVDLLRFARSFDAGASPRLLSDATVRTMFERPDGERGPVYYGLGWNVRELGRAGRINTWHTGSLDGTSTLLVRRFDRIAWAVLFNGRTAPNGQRFSDVIDPLLHQAASQVRTWPQIDQFNDLR